MQPSRDATAPPPEFSIVIGIVSTEDHERVFETLDALRSQTGGHTYEVVLGDRMHDHVAERIRSDYPEAQVVECPATATLPELRTAAFDRTSGRRIVVTEDHCVPSEDWLESFARAFREAPDGTAAVGGCVENGVCDRSLDWATFLTEYSYFLPPVHEGVGDVLPGMNVAYDRSAFDGVSRETLTSGFWETTLHPLLLRDGRKLFSSNAIRLFHCKRFSFRLFARQRFVYSRYYAALRFPRSAVAKRLVATVLSIVLPPLLLFRMVRQIRAKQRGARELLGALPYLAVFVVIWAWGEMYGYAFGTGGALREIE